MLGTMRVLVNIEKHFDGPIEKVPGTVIDQVGPYTIVRLDNGDRKVICDTNWFY